MATVAHLLCLLEHALPWLASAALWCSLVQHSGAHCWLGEGEEGRSLTGERGGGGAGLRCWPWVEAQWLESKLGEDRHLWCVAHKSRKLRPSSHVEGG
jgi:hypothetical protein